MQQAPRVQPFALATAIKLKELAAAIATEADPSRCEQQYAEDVEAEYEALHTEVEMLKAEGGTSEVIALTRELERVEMELVRERCRRLELEERQQVTQKHQAAQELALANCGSVLKERAGLLQAKERDLAELEAMMKVLLVENERLAAENERLAQNGRHVAANVAFAVSQSLSAINEAVSSYPSYDRDLLGDETHRDALSRSASCPSSRFVPPTTLACGNSDQLAARPALRQDESPDETESTSDCGPPDSSSDSGPRDSSSESDSKKSSPVLGEKFPRGAVGVRLIHSSSESAVGDRAPSTASSCSDRRVVHRRSLPKGLVALETSTVTSASYSPFEHSHDVEPPYSYRYVLQDSEKEHLERWVEPLLSSACRPSSTSRLL